MEEIIEINSSDDDLMEANYRWYQEANRYLKFRITNDIFSNTCIFTLFRIICGHRHSQMMSPLLFCRTERDLNGEEDDYLPDLEGEQAIRSDRRNVPQGTQCNAF